MPVIIQIYVQFFILKRLDYAKSSSKFFSFSKVFSFAFRFKQMCETLLIDDPIDYGSKIVDLLWRKGAYDPIQIFKRDRNEYDESTTIEFQITYRMHLSAVFSFYTNLLIKFSSMIKPYRNWNRFLDFMPFTNEIKRKSEQNDRFFNLVFN